MKPIDRLHALRDELLDLTKGRTSDGKPTHIPPPKSVAGQNQARAEGYAPIPGGKTWAHSSVRRRGAGRKAPEGEEREHAERDGERERDGGERPSDPPRMASTLLVMNELYRGINDRDIDVPLSRRLAIQKTVQRALATMLAEVPLSYARSLDTHDRTALMTAVQHVLDTDDQIALSKRWDPGRGKIESADVPSLGVDLAALLDGAREPYSGISVTLAEARNSSSREMNVLRATLSRVAPTKDLKAVLKRWDPHFETTDDRRALARRAIALLDGAAQPSAGQKTDRAQDPASRPPATRARRRRGEE